MRIVDAQEFQAEHCETNTQHLSGTEMSVGYLGIAQQFVKASSMDRGLPLTARPNRRQQLRRQSGL